LAVPFFIWWLWPWPFFGGWESEPFSITENFLKKDYLIRGVFLGKGTAKIRFVFKPASFYSGAILSGITLLLLGFFWEIRGLSKTKIGGME